MKEKSCFKKNKDILYEPNMYYIDNLENNTWVYTREMLTFFCLKGQQLITDRHTFK